MPDVPRPPPLPPTAGPDGLKDGTAAEAALEPESPAGRRVGWGFITLYTLAYMSTILLFLAPLLVTLALKVNSLVGSNGHRTAWRSSPVSVHWWRCSATRSSAG